MAASSSAHPVAALRAKCNEGISLKHCLLLSLSPFQRAKQHSGPFM